MPVCMNCMKELDSVGVCPCCGFDGASYTPESHQLLPNTILRERYRIGRVLGEGGFGITYAGWDTTLGMKVAVKEFYMSGFVNRNHTVSQTVTANSGDHTEIFERNREHFFQEARVLARFAGEPGIVWVRDFFRENNTAYIVMEFLSGVTLGDYLKRSGKLSWEKTLELLQPVLDSLCEVHKENIIHRDISPDNIMLTDRRQVKLLDFGAARAFSQKEQKSLSVILKPGYAPFEQYQTRGRQGPWTDVYALCATIYRCMTGIVPENANDRVFHDPVQPPAVLCGCPQAVSDVIMKGLALQVDYRWQTIGELCDALEQAKAAPKAVPDPVQDDIPTVYAGPARQTYDRRSQPVSDQRISGSGLSAEHSAAHEPQQNIPVKPAEKAEVRQKPAEKKKKPVPEQEIEPEIQALMKPRIMRDVLIFVLLLAVLAAIFFGIRKLSDMNRQAESGKDASISSESEKDASVQAGQGQMHDTAHKEFFVPTVLLDGIEMAQHSPMADGYRMLAEVMDISRPWNVIQISRSGYGASSHTATLEVDGTVVVFGDNSYGQCQTGDWSEIVSVDTGAYHTVGLRADGTVMAAGVNSDGQCDVENWTEIVSVGAGTAHTVGLRADGTVVATGSNASGECEVSSWRNVVQIAVGPYHTVGLREDGTVIACGSEPAFSSHGKLQQWADIVQIAAGDSHTVGLRSDGTVVALGFDGSGQTDTGSWTDVVGIDACGSTTVAVRSDGTAYAVGDDQYGQCAVQEWTHVVGIAAGYTYTVGVGDDAVGMVVSNRYD